MRLAQQNQPGPADCRHQQAHRLQPPAVHADKINEMYSLEVLASQQAQGNLGNLAHPDDEGTHLFESLMSVNDGVDGHMHGQINRFYPFSCEPERPPHAHTPPYTLMGEDESRTIFKATKAHYK